MEWQGRFSVTHCDNDPEYITQMMHRWAKDLDIHIEFSQLGNPRQNVCVERFNRTARSECSAGIIGPGLQKSRTMCNDPAEPAQLRPLMQML
jgi:transposase InsO family protein